MAFAGEGRETNTWPMVTGWWTTLVGSGERSDCERAMRLSGTEEERVTGSRGLFKKASIAAQLARPSSHTLGPVMFIPLFPHG